MAAAQVEHAVVRLRLEQLDRGLVLVHGLALHDRGGDAADDAGRVARLARDERRTAHAHDLPTSRSAARTPSQYVTTAPAMADAKPIVSSFTPAMQLRGMTTP